MAKRKRRHNDGGEDDAEHPKRRWRRDDDDNDDAGAAQLHLKEDSKEKLVDELATTIDSFEGRLAVLEEVVHPQAQEDDYHEDMFLTPFRLRIQENPNIEVPTLQAYFELTYLPSWPEHTVNSRIDRKKSFPVKVLRPAIDKSKISEVKSEIEKLNIPKRDYLRNLRELGPKLKKYTWKNFHSFKNSYESSYNLAKREWEDQNHFFANITKFHYFYHMKRLHKRYGNEDSVDYIGRHLSFSSQMIYPGTTRTAGEISDALYEAYRVRVGIGSFTDIRGFHYFTHVCFGLDMYGEICDVASGEEFDNGRSSGDKLIIEEEYGWNGPKFRYN